MELLSDERIARELERSAWRREGDEIVRDWKLADFGSAIEFVNRVGELAEAEDHHPAIVTEWGRVTVTWWTHKIRGLHRNDFVAAAKTDRLEGAA